MVLEISVSRNKLEGTKKAAWPLFLRYENKVPRKCRQAIILNLKVQGGRLPDASGASAWDAHNSITMVSNQFSKNGSKNMDLNKHRREQL